ncbi:hypothetical protein ACIBKY_52085 [Nonomuraea sp. NPDC050394]|uniref:hypothetical protein n=1 Tax=Nonomuraea sp. NPDC050394 TaxID=3364363 RepID=UPI00379BA7AF
MAYATSSDYQTYTGQTPPEGIALLLTRASREVDTVLLSSVYPVDEDGLPTEAAHITAVMEATCEQVAAWVEEGETGTGTSGKWDDVRIGSVQLASRGRGSQAGAGGGGSAAARLAPQAWEVLQLAGLTGHSPRTNRCAGVADG